MSIQVTPIPRLTVLTVPAFTLGTANAAGAASTAIASDSTLLAFDGTLPDAIAYGQSGAAGAVAVAARRDHSHAMASATVLSTSVINFTRSAAAVSGDVSYTGAGFTPTGVIVISLNNTENDGFSIGFIDDGATDEKGSLLYGIAGTPKTAVEGAQCVTIYADNASDGQVASSKSLDVDGVTLTWTKVNSGQAVEGTIFFLR